MFQRTKQLVCLSSIVILGSLGCSQSDQGPSAGAVAAAPAAQKPTETPEAAVNTVIEGLRASKPVVLWDCLPSSLQHQLNTTVRNIASKTDREVFDHSVVSLKKLVRVMETKKEFALASAFWNSFKGLKKEELSANWQSVIDLLKTATESELADLEKLKQFDGHEFLSGTGVKLYTEWRAFAKATKSDLFKPIDEMKATFKDEKTDTPKATLTWPGGKPVDITLIASDGRWTPVQAGLIPILLNNSVERVLALFRPYRLMEWKEQYLKDLARIDHALDDMLAAKTSEEFQAGVKKMTPVLFSRAIQFAQKRKKPTPREEIALGREQLNTAFIVIKGDHFADEPAVAELVTAAREAKNSDPNGMLVGPTRQGGATTLLVYPVPNIEAFAKNLHAAKVGKVDVKQCTMELEVPSTEDSDKQVAKDKPAPKETAAAK